MIREWLGECGFEQGWLVPRWKIEYPMQDVSYFSTVSN